MKQVDVVVIGGGPIGAIAAMVFRRIFPKVMLLEQRVGDQFLQATRSRTLALNSQSLKILNDFHLLEPLKKHMSPLEQVHISVKGHLGATRIKADSLGLRQLGGVIEQHHLERELYQSLQAHDVEVVDGANFSHLTMDDVCHVDYSQGEQKQSLQAHYCVGCDGQHSKVRQAMGIDASSTDYHQTAMVSIVELTHPHHQIAYEHFCEQGAVALLPMQGKLATCIWTVPTLDALQIERLDHQQFAAGMVEQFNRLGSFEPRVLFRKSFALQSTLAHAQAVSKGLLLGNAAHSLHPIAAQGLNLSLRDLSSLRKQMSQKNSSMVDLFNSYDQQRHADQQNMFRYTHFMATKVGTHVIPLWAKSLGILATDFVPGIKQKMSRFNLGVSV